MLGKKCPAAVPACTTGARESSVISIMMRWLGCVEVSRTEDSKAAKRRRCGKPGLPFRQKLKEITKAPQVVDSLAGLLGLNTNVDWSSSMFTASFQ